MDDGLKDFIEELREYGNARRGELAGMILEAANRLECMPHWITDRNPTSDEVKQAGNIGFILCFSGKVNGAEFDHAIDMGGNTYEGGFWYLHGVLPDRKVSPRGAKFEIYKVHGWMLPPSWEGWR